MNFHRYIKRMSKYYVCVRNCEKFVSYIIHCHFEGEKTNQYLPERRKSLLVNFVHGGVYRQIFRVINPGRTGIELLWRTSCEEYQIDTGSFRMTKIYAKYKLFTEPCRNNVYIQLLTYFQSYQNSRYENNMPSGKFGLFI